MELKRGCWKREGLCQREMGFRCERERREKEVGNEEGVGRGKRRWQREMRGWKGISM